MSLENDVFFETSRSGRLKSKVIGIDVFNMCSIISSQQINSHNRVLDSKEIQNT